WLDEIRADIIHGTLPTLRDVAVDEDIDKWRFSSLLMTCLESCKAKKVMQEIHFGSCGNNSRERSLAIKVKRQGYFWQKMIGDCKKFARKCEKCQRHARQFAIPPRSYHPFPRHILSCVGQWIS